MNQNLLSIALSEEDIAAVNAALGDIESRLAGWSRWITTPLPRRGLILALALKDTIAGLLVKPRMEGHSAACRKQQAEIQKLEFQK